MEPFQKITLILISVQIASTLPRYIEGLRLDLVAGLDIMWRYWAAYARHCECTGRVVHVGNCCA